MWRWRSDDTDPSIPWALHWALAASLVPAFGLGLWMGVSGGADTVETRRAAYAFSPAQAAGLDVADAASPESPPIVMAVAEVYRPRGGTGIPADAVGPDSWTYPLIPGTRAFAWPDGGASGGVDSGIAMLLVSQWERGASASTPATRFALANLAEQPGFTSFVTLFLDANGLLDYVCMRLNERQVEYIDFDTWGYINRGFVGHAIVSAYHWDHDVLDDRGLPARNTVGLAVGVVEGRRSIGEAGAEIVSLSGLRQAIPMDIGASEEQQDRSFVGWHGLCVRGPGFFGPSPTPDPRDSPTPTPSPTATPTPWPTPRAPASRAVRAPALRFPSTAWQSTTVPSADAPSPECSGALVIYNPGPDPARLLIVAQPVPAADELGAGVACARGFTVECTGLVPPHQPWRWILPESLADGAALTVLALDERPLRDDGIDAPGSHADWLCATLERELAAGCLRWPALLEAWRSRSTYLPHPADPTGPAALPIRSGPPVFVERWITCGEVDSVAASHTGRDLGWAPPAETGEGGESLPRAWTYGLPLPAAAAHAEGRDAPSGDEGSGDASRVLARVQTATGLETAVDVAWLREADGEAFPCGRWTLPGGGARAIEVTDCVNDGLETDGAHGSGAAGALRFVADAPVAIAVDVAMSRGSTLPASLPALPLLRNDPRSQPPLHAADDVAFAPLLYHGVDGWHSRLRVHNPDPTRLARVSIELIDLSGRVAAVRILGRLRPGASHMITLDDLPELSPGVYQVRVRRQGGEVAPTLTPGPPPPRPTATIAPERTPAPIATRTATRVPLPTRPPLPTATVAFGRTPTPTTAQPLWLPRLEAAHR